MPTLPSSRRVRVRRAPQRAVYEREQIDAILDEAIVCHVGFVHDGQPYVIPTLHARVGDVIYLHGSTASRMVRTLATGAPCSVTATLLDGIVLARSAFHHSANYRSVTILGNATVVRDEDERMSALRAFTQQLVPGRWEHVRPPSRQEMKGTQVLALGLDEVSAKVRSGPPIDDDEDLALDVWAGEMPLALQAGEPRPDSQQDAIALPEHVRAWRAARRAPLSADAGAKAALTAFAGHVASATPG